MIVCAVILWPMVETNLPDLSQQPEYRLTASDIQINKPPHWVPHQFVEDAIERVGFPAEMSLLDKNLTLDMAKLFAPTSVGGRSERGEESFISGTTLGDSRIPVARLP